MSETGGLGESLETLERTLLNKRKELAREIAQIDRDLLAIEAVRGVGHRMGFGSVTPAAHPSTSGTATVESFRPRRLPSPIHKVTTFPEEPREPVDRAVLAIAVRADLGPPRDDGAIPPAVVDGVRAGVHDAPNRGRALLAVRDSVQGIAGRAAAATPEKQRRRTMSAAGLVHGEQVAPALRVVLAAADRALTTYEVAVAMLEARGLRMVGPKLTAVVNRVSALLVQDRKKSKAHAFKRGDGKELLWVSPRRMRLLPPDHPAWRQAEAAFTDKDVAAIGECSNSPPAVSDERRNASGDAGNDHNLG